MDKVMRNEDHVQEIVSKSGQNFLYQAHANSHLHESLSIWRIVNSGDRLCGLVVRVSGDPRRYQIF